MESPLRAIGRLFVYGLATLCLIPTQLTALALNKFLSVEIPIGYHRLCCKILGIKIVIRGVPSEAHPTLFVSNHVSYIDITVLGSVIRGSFVAKSEVADWPFFGLLAKLQRTVFVARRGPDARRHRNELISRLAGGDNLILFPEGTSDDGTRVLPFKSALFSVAEQELDHGPLTVQPVSIAYTRLDSIPLGRNFRTYYAWYGDMDLLPHFWSWVGLGVVTVEVTFHAPQTLAGHGDRKALASHCHERVSAGVTDALTGVADQAPVAVSEHA